MSKVKGPATNPLQNDLILEKIFEFCNVPSLKNCRLVSTKWRDHSLKAWRAKAMIKLGPEQELGIGEFLKLVNPNPDDENEEDYLHLRRHPFKRYLLVFDDDEDEYEEQKRLAVSVANHGARHVSIDWRSDRVRRFQRLLLTLVTDSLESLEVNSDVFYYVVPSGPREPYNAPNLKRLRLFSRGLNGEHTYLEHLLWPYLLNSFPNVEALSVAYYLYEDQSGEEYSACVEDRLAIARFLMQLRLLFGEEKDFNLKELEMIEVYANQKTSEHRDKEGHVILSLALCQFPLEKLSIHVGWPGGENVLILLVLASCQLTLQYLHASINFSKALLRRHYDHEKGRITRNLKPQRKRVTVCLPQLKEIWLVNGLEWAMFLLSHLELPRLEKLKVEWAEPLNPYMEYENARYGHLTVKVPPGMIYERLETFELQDNLSMPGPDLIRKFAKMMPNLAHLTIHLNKRSFPMVCEHLKGLKTLNVLSGQGIYAELDDEGLTGISKAQMEREGGPSFRQPNITDLEHLTDLSISCDRQLKRDDVKFTEHSVIYGFLQLKRLYYLSIAFKEISVEMKEKLLSHVKGEVHFQKKQEAPSDTFVVEIVSDDEDDAGGKIEEKSGAAPE